MHNNGHVQEPASRTAPGEFRRSAAQSLHCGYTKLPHNRKVHHSFDELDLGHVIEEELLELVAAWSQGRPNRRATPGVAARPTPPPPRPRLRLHTTNASMPKNLTTDWLRATPACRRTPDPKTPSTAMEGQQRRRFPPSFKRPATKTKVSGARDVRHGPRRM